MHYLLTAAKRRIKQVPWLYTLLVRAYVCMAGVRARLTRKNLGAVLCKYPHLHVYACHVNTIIKGKASVGLRNIGNQIIVDWRNWRVLRKNRAALGQLKQLYQDAILCCIEHRVNRWWEFLPNAKFDSVQTLDMFLLKCVFGRAGDYNEYVRIKTSLQQLLAAPSGQDDCYYKMAQHYAKVMEDIDAGILTRELKLDTSKRPFLLGCSVWGEQYLNMLLNYGLPSLLAEGNLPALCKERQPILFIHTNPESKRQIEQSEIIHRLKALGVTLHYRMLDESLIALFNVDPNFKYWHLGMVQSLDLYVAKALDADYHILFPDVIYSHSFFAGMIKAAAQDHKAITRLGLSTRMEGICPAIDRYRHDGVIDIPAADLAALSVSHIHSASWSWIATNKNLATELPNAYMIAWEGRDTIHLLSSHQTILYLDREILRDLPKRYYLTLDSELDKIIPANIPVYCPRPKDGMYLIEVTSEKQRPTELKRNSIEEFCRTFWYGAQASMDYWRFFDHGIIDSLNRDMLPDRSYMDDADLTHAKQTLKNILLERRPSISANEAANALAVLREVCVHPKAKNMKGHIEGLIQSFEAVQDTSKSSAETPVRGWRKRYHLSQKNRRVLEKLYREAILCCIRHRVHRWWNLLPNAKFNSIPALQSFLREGVLRRAGDYQEFLRIRGELQRLSIATLENETFLDNLSMHYSHVMDEIDAGILSQGLTLDPSKRPFLIGFSVWGERYLNMLLNYCLPSMMAAGNLKALCEERQPILFIHTDPESQKIIECADILHRMKALGVQVVYKMINATLVEHFNDAPGNIYWHLGMVQSLDLFFAKKLGADYHLLMPDSIYSDHHFAGLLRAVKRGHKVIIRLMLSTCMEKICPAVEPYRRDGVIAIPAADLTALSVANIHSASQSWVITNNNLATEMPGVHVAILEGKDTLHMLSPHQTLVYLDQEVMRDMPKRFYFTLDSELDKIIPDGYSIYCPKPDDEICLIEATSEKQRPMELAKYPIQEFCRAFWYSTQESMNYWKIFDESNIDPLKRGLLPGRNYMGEEEINRAKQTIKNALLETYPAVSNGQAKLALEILKAVRSHPDAQSMLHLIDAEAAAIQNDKEEPYKHLSAA